MKYPCLIFSLLISTVLVSNFDLIYADSEPVFITYSEKMESILFDGKWSFFSEWKESSLTEVGELLKIRTAHYDDFIYVFVDVLNDKSLDKGSDRAVVCLDSKNNKSIISDSNDFCFIATLDREIGFTLQGGSDFGSKNNFKKIPNHENFIAIGTTSDQNDRYLKIPHPSYEFKIPTDLINRNNEYGFYIQTFDANSGKILDWPQNISTESLNGIPSPSVWGEMISLDKSLPEFPLPMFILAVLLLTMIIVSRKLNYGRLRINTQ